MPTYFAQRFVAAQIKVLGGRPITIAGVTVLGLVDRYDEELLPGEAATGVGKVIEVRIATDSLPGLGVGVSATVDGESMVVRQVRQEKDDSAFTSFRCST